MTAPRSLKVVIAADLLRYRAPRSLKGLARTYVRSPGFRAVLWHRLCVHLRSGSGLRRLAYLAARVGQKRVEYRFGIVLPPTAKIGPGLLISHWGGIVVNESAVIGANCNLGNDVTLGKAHRGRKAGVPRIGDRVFIAPGSRIIGGIIVGDDAVVGANAVVVKNVPPKAVVGGNPAKILSYQGSIKLVNDLS